MPLKTRLPIIKLMVFEVLAYATYHTKFLARLSLSRFIPQNHLPEICSSTSQFYYLLSFQLEQTIITHKII